ncbi:MAG: hypothetical protein IT430_18690 [Phycisphaerales bacterium]|nr:hypothetical protein [Phycisphaerales bacterium]
MPPLEHRLRHVNRLSDAAAVAALADALEHAEVDECPALADALLQRPCSEAVGVLIRRWHDLDDDLRRRTADLAGGAPAAIAAAAEAAEPVQRRNALMLIGRAGQIRGLDEAVKNLTHHDPLVSRAAAEAIDRLTLLHLGRGSDERARKADAQRLDEALAEALDAYPKHRQTAVLVAAARFIATPGPALRRWMADRDHPTHMAMRGFMKRLPEEQLAPHLLTWLGIDSLGSQALEHIARLAPTPHFAAMIADRAHLLHLPQQQARLRRLDPRRPAAPPSAIALELDAAAQAALPEWIMTVPISDEQRIMRLSDGLAFRTPRARLAAFRALANLRDGRADAVAMRFCFDEDERLAALAVRHCIRRRVAGLAETLRQLLRGPHRSVRTIAAAHSNRADFESMWSYWSGSGPRVEQRLAARLLMREQPEAIISEIRRRLSARQRETCLRAIRLAGDLQILPEIELELLALTRGADVRLCATAVKALGAIDSDSSRQAVLAGLRHADVRTRANAIEVLAPPLIETCRDVLEQLCKAPDNRPRANAIAAIARIDRDAAAARLEQMLGDPRPLHRLSALWAAEVSALTPCATRVAELARRDASRPVRERARRTARRLLAAMTAHRPAPQQSAQDAGPAEREVTPREVVALHPANAAAPAAAGPLSRLVALPLMPVSLAQSSRLEDISRSFVGRESDWPWLSWSALGVVLLGAGVIGATLMALRWSVRDARRHGPAYRAVAAGLGLSRRQRRLLDALAVRSGRINAAGLLLSRGTFDHHLRAWRQSGAKHADAQGDQLAIIRARLFG